ncbi:hypothetical protein pdam_00018474 [Pocillopora damicornis]|uniref:Uncharacterized protein n=1 Tax=Pocillopora damicornis TaxID=46731 RepID=A0A3M6UEJ5_POCDA|nr:hypothetical protein pdam_00018474 [Pocillopora damicornis]
MRTIQEEVPCSKQGDPCNFILRGPHSLSAPTAIPTGCTSWSSSWREMFKNLYDPVTCVLLRKKFGDE